MGNYDYVEGIPVATVTGDLQPGSTKQINADLAETTNTAYEWPLAGYEAICNCLEEHGIELPLDIPGEDNSDELVFALKNKTDISDDSEVKPDENQLYLYICYEENEEGKFEFYAEIVDESGLHDLLDEFDDGAEQRDSTEDE